MSREADEEQQEERRLAREREQDDAKKALISTSLPFDLVLRIIALLPSPVLFGSRLCKAAHELALLTLAHRPFFVFQQAPLSSLCFLLPLDSPSTPLPCSFKLAKPSFELSFAYGNLLCLRRQYPSMLDICVCNIFRRWNVTLPPIVHPSLATRLLRRVFFEDYDVDSLSIVGFHVQPIIDSHAAHAHQDFSPEYRIFVASNTYLRVYDSCTQQWSSRAYFPTRCSSQLSGRVARARPPGYFAILKPPQCFATSDGNLILTFSSMTCALFKYEDQSFHDMGLPFHPSIELAGYPANACVDASFNLRVWFPHIESNSQSTSRRGLELRELCKSEHGLPCVYTFHVSDQWYLGGFHEHKYERRLWHSHCFAHQGKIYALVMESEEMQCNKERAARQRTNFEWRTISAGDIEMILHNQDAEFYCDQFFPRHSPRKLTLYSGCVDMTNWTMHVCKEADASTFLEYLGNNDTIAGKLLLG